VGTDANEQKKKGMGDMKKILSLSILLFLLIFSSNVFAEISGMSDTISVQVERAFRIDPWLLIILVIIIVFFKEYQRHNRKNLI